MNWRILIAFRNDDCRRNLIRLFASRGVLAQSVWTDADLLLEVLERDYDVIFYDLEMSRLNDHGFKIVKILRRIRPKVSLVVISDDLAVELRGKILREGVAFYALKPINSDAIEEALSEMLSMVLN